MIGKTIIKTYQIIITFFILNTIYVVPILAQDIKVESVFCRGIYSTQNSLKYAEWNIIKRISNFKIIFKLGDDSRTAKFKVRKGNAGIIVGTGGWERETGEKTYLNMFFSQTNKSFKMTSRYSYLRVQGLCDKKIIIN